LHVHKVSLGEECGAQDAQHAKSDANHENDSFLAAVQTQESLRKVRRAGAVIRDALVQVDNDTPDEGAHEKELATSSHAVLESTFIWTAREHGNEVGNGDGKRR
jgi:hypothetical protein